MTQHNAQGLSDSAPSNYKNVQSSNTSHIAEAKRHDFKINVSLTKHNCILISAEISSVLFNLSYFTMDTAHNRHLLLSTKLQIQCPHC